MKKAPIPENETERLVAVKAMDILDTPPEEQFDQITRLAQHYFNVPICLITIVDANREWFKSCQGVDSTEGSRDISFCGHAVNANDLFVIEDTLKDKRFADNPVVLNAPHIRFYAGQSLRGLNGHKVGVFCIKDTSPRRFSEYDKLDFKALASWAQLILNIRNITIAFEQRDQAVEEMEIKKTENKFLHKLIVSRELRMIELKNQIEVLRQEIGLLTNKPVTPSSLF